MACRIEGAIPKGITAGPSALCQHFLQLLKRRPGTVVVRFHRPDSVSAQVTLDGRGQRRVYPEVTVSESDRAVDMKTIAALVQTIADQLDAR